MDSDWIKSKQPGGTFKLNKYDENFSQVMYEIYENISRLRNVAATILSNIEKKLILTINSSTENKNRWEGREAVTRPTLEGRGDKKAPTQAIVNSIARWAR